MISYDLLHSGCTIIFLCTVHGFHDFKCIAGAFLDLGYGEGSLIACPSDRHRATSTIRFDI